MPQESLMSTAEYLCTPETKVPTELIYGVLRVADSPMPHHQAAVADFHIALAEHVRQNRLGRIWLSPLDVILNAERALILQPDLLFISNERSHIVTDRVRGGPDMVLEVLSPHPRIGRLDERVAWFAEYGVRECWLLHQAERRLDVLSCADGRVAERHSFDAHTAIQSNVLPAFERSVDSILAWA